MKFKLFLFLLLGNQILLAQDNLLWKRYFSYNEIVDVVASNEAIFAATENCIFTNDSKLVHYLTALYSR